LEYSKLCSRLSRLTHHILSIHYLVFHSLSLLFCIVAFMLVRPPFWCFGFCCLHFSS
jgi:hypothetical protein